MALAEAAFHPASGVRTRSSAMRTCLVTGRLGAPLTVWLVVTSTEAIALALPAATSRSDSPASTRRAVVLVCTLRIWSAYCWWFFWNSVSSGPRGGRLPDGQAAVHVVVVERLQVHRDLPGGGQRIVAGGRVLGRGAVQRGPPHGAQHHHGHQAEPGNHRGHPGPQSDLVRPALGRVTGRFVGGATARQKGSHGS